MVVERLARRAETRRLSELEARDGLLQWFLKRGERQIRAGMRYTAPGASLEEIQRVAQARARAFFLGLVSSWERPTRADLRRVHARMQRWLLPEPRARKALALECERWDRLLRA